MRYAALLLLAVLALAGCGQTVPRENPRFPMVHAPTPGVNYRIRVGDVIQVDVFQEPLMTMRQRVLADGTISVALIGRLSVAGRTVEQAAASIAAVLDKKQLVNPQVTITILAYAPRRFTVWGQVKTPGTYVIPPEEVVSLPEAIAMAGGNTVIGNSRRTVVSRNVGESVEQLRVDATAPEAQRFLVTEGDVIHVPETAF